MNTRIVKSPFASVTPKTALAVLLALLATPSVRASTFSLVQLPAQQTDPATGINPAKHYVCAFCFGNAGLPANLNVNGVPFTHFILANNTFTSTNVVDANFGGNVTLSNSVAGGLRNTSSATQGNLYGVASGNTFEILEGPIYTSGTAIGTSIQAQFGTLTPGDTYSLRVFYRYWGNTIGDRNATVACNGEGIWDLYPGNPLSEDAGTNGVAPNGSKYGGANYIEYDFTAAGTSVIFSMTNAGPTANNLMIYAATLEDSSAAYTPPPFFTYQPYVSATGVPSTLSAEVIGAPTVTYQWYVNTNNKYSGATMLTDGNGYLGSTTTNLMITNNIQGYFYYLVANNTQGYTTSSIAQIYPSISISPSVNTLYQTPATPAWRDNYSGGSGCKFTVGPTNVVVSHLGYFSSNIVSGLNISHYVTIFAGSGSPPPVIAQVTIPAGLAADYYTNKFFWMPLDPPVLLASNTTYYVATLPINGDGDWWGDSFTATFNGSFVGSTTNSVKAPGTVYGPGGYGWPPTGFSLFGSNTTYCVEGMANLPIDQARVGVQTTNLTVRAGGTISVMGFATGQTPINYQWWFGGSPLGGQTSATLTIPSASSGNNGTYYLTATNALGGEQSANVTIQVSDSPVGIQQGLTNETVFAHYLANFSMVVTGTPPISVQWSSNSVVIPSAATIDLVSPTASSSFSEWANYPANNGDVYIALASNYLNSAHTAQSSSTLTVLPNLAYPQEFLFTSSPPTNVFSGNGGGGVENAVGGTFTVANTVEITHLGYVAVGLIIEGQAALTDNHNLSLYLWNNGSPQLLGYTTVMAGTPTNSEINGYFWAPLNPPLVLSNNTQYLLSAQEFNGADDWGNLVAVTNLNPYFSSYVQAVYANSITWPTPPTLGGYGAQMYCAVNMASLTNFLLAEISPAGNVTLPASSSFTLTAYGAGQPPLYYPQWYFNGAALAGQTNATLTLSPLNTSSAGNYYVVLSNYQASITVTSAVTTLQVPPLTVLAAGEPIWNQTSQTNIIVYFSDLLDPATATTAGNYFLDNSASVLSAALVGASNEVVLTTSVLNPSTSYTLTVQSVNDDYGDTLSPSPTNLTIGLYPANLALWVRADTGVTTNADGTVIQWNDLSGNGNNLSGSSGIYSSPSLAADASGNPVVRFAGTNNAGFYMALVANPTASLGILGDISIVAVVNFATLAGGTNGEIISKTGLGGSYPTKANYAAPYDYYENGNPVALLYRGTGTNYGVFGATKSPSVGAPHILAVSQLANTVTHYLDGRPASSGVLNATTADAGGYLNVGARSDGVNRLSGDLSELILAGSALSSWDIAALDAYLAARHQVVLFDTNPTNIVVSTAGGKVTMSWPLDHTGWLLQSNSIGLTTTSAWYSVAGSTATNEIIVAPDLTKTNVFYRMLEQP